MTGVKSKIQERMTKRRWRAKRGKAIEAAKRETDKARCADLARLEARVDKQGDGCWIWTGLVRGSWARVVPIIRVGQAYMQADRAMWLATRGKPVPRQTWLSRTCERLDCIAPDHLYEENLVTLRSRARLKELEKSSPSTYKEVMENLK